MKKYISLLRGINVGGHKKIRMADLKAMFIKCGYENPITYIQSGNVVFESKESNQSVIEKQISSSILETFGFEVPVIIRTVEELKSAVKNNPFHSESVDEKKLHITFLEKSPDNETIVKIENTILKNDKFKIVGKEVYVYVEGSYYKTKISNQFFEKQLKVSTTTRNWRTVNKLLKITEPV